VALAGLRDALSNLRLLLHDREAAVPFVQVNPGVVQFRTGDNFWLDVSAFGRLAAGPPDLASMEQAAALYRDGFMAGFPLEDCPAFEEWLLLQQERLKRQMTVALCRLVSIYESRAEHNQAQTHIRRWLELDPYDEEAQRYLMRTLALEGRRNAALVQYGAYRRLLAEDLDVEPEAETTALYQHLRDGKSGNRAIRGLDGPDPLTPFSPLSFVGREQELAKLNAFLDLALAGQGRVVFVTGEPGSGKTALLTEFGRRAIGAHGVLTVACGSCNAHAGAGDPYLPFCEILQTLAGDVEGRRASGTLPPEQARRLWAMLPATAQALADHGPDLLDTFVPGVALLQRVDAFASHSSAWRTRLEEAALRGRAHHVVPAALAQPRDLFAQFTAVLAVLARQHPLLLLLDDLHWADGGTAALLFHLGRRLAGSRILLVGAYRPSSLDARRLSGERHPLELVINELGREQGDIGVDLDQADGRQFVDAFLDAEPNHLGPAFRRALYQHTDGNPLFTVELVRSFQRSGALVRDNASRWTEGPALDWNRWPPQVETIIAGHVAELPPGDRDLLTAASVQGETFIAEVVARVLQAEEDAVIRRLSGPLSKQHCLVSATQLEQLEASSLGAGPGPEGQQRRDTAAGQRLSRYRFRHILVQDYLYRCLDEVERGCLHEATGRALEALFAPAPASLEALAAQLARHFAAAGLPTQAAAYHLRAGERAARLTAYEEAILHLRRGLAQLEPLPESPERARLRMALHQALAASLDLCQAPEPRPALRA